MAICQGCTGQGNGDVPTPRPTQKPDPTTQKPNPTTENTVIPDTTTTPADEECCDELEVYSTAGAQVHYNEALGNVHIGWIHLLW